MRGSIYTPKIDQSTLFPVGGHAWRELTPGG
jgi:hypothetical protein